MTWSRCPELMQWPKPTKSRQVEHHTELISQTRVTVRKHNLYALKEITTQQAVHVFGYFHISRGRIATE